MSATIALNRFGLGARPGEAASIADPRRWLLDQLTAPPAPLPHEAALPDSAAVARDVLAFRSMSGKAKRMAARAYGRDRVQADREAWWTSRLITPAPFFHRWWAFFGNHFTVSAAKRTVSPFWGVYQRDALRPHVLGRFEDLVLAAVQHPAMILYLDNQRSVGPRSRAGTRRGAGRNENLAREILELHTLGVSGGYTQDDIQGLARVLTGWSVARSADGLSGAGFQFWQRAHEPGSKRVLGEDVGEGRAAGEALLRRMANHPSTRRFVCHKLAVHFVRDVPPKRLVRAMEQAWQASGGTLTEVGKALVSHPDAWDPTLGKVKSPQDLVASLGRAVGATDGATAAQWAQRLGQPEHAAPSPAGWSDTAHDWLGAETTLSRIDAATKAAQARRDPPLDPAALGPDLLGAAYGGRLAAEINASDARIGAILLFASPAFQRR